MRWPTGELGEIVRRSNELCGASDGGVDDAQPVAIQRASGMFARIVSPYSGIGSKRVAKTCFRYPSMTPPCFRESSSA